jgi:hypothetical protein
MALGEWINGTPGHTWYRGKGIGREEIKGPCVFRDNDIEYILERNELGNLFGMIPYVKRQNYRAGNLYFHVDEDGNRTTKVSEFKETYTSNKGNWDACDYANPIDERTSVTAPNQPESDFTPAVYNSTPITENIDWRIALAIALVILIGIYAAVKLR